MVKYVVLGDLLCLWIVDCFMLGDFFFIEIGVVLGFFFNFVMYYLNVLEFVGMVLCFCLEVDKWCSYVYLVEIVFCGFIFG